ncbi:hypothetical protein BOX15_Mlig011488g1, partial [Macrostomum lignano]
CAHLQMPPVVMDAISEEKVAKLLDFNHKLDIGLLDSVVTLMYSSTGSQQQMAQQVLTTLKEHPDAWTRVDSILEYSGNQQSKYYALQILENLIKTRWKVLPREQCEGIKRYIVGLVIKTSSNPQMLESEKVYLGKLNMILVQILKHEWPKNWPSFISDIVGSSKSNESLCQNNMVILKLLSEEVFEFNSGQLTQVKARHLKDNMCAEFSLIFQLCQHVLDNSQNAPLVAATLETLLKFTHWIPLGYLFQTKLIATLVHKFLNVPMFRNVTLKCLTEIAGVQTSEYNDQFVQLFCLTTERLKEMLPISTNIREAYQRGRDDEQNFIQNLSLFYCTFLREHASLVETSSALQGHFSDALTYLVLISEVDEVEIFKICLEYWNSLCTELYRENPFVSVLPEVGRPDRRRVYWPVLSSLRRIMISRMAKPEEVLVVENEQGEVVREFMKDTDSVALYKSMRETLVYLTHLDPVETERVITEKLLRQVDGSEWSWKNLSTLCWAVGSISGAMNEDDERRFIVVVIRELLGLCEHKQGKDNKAIVAANIMYVVGQYPRFLRAHWRFLKTVVNKLFEFMHETHEGVQDMACDTFIKIANKCRRQFVQLQAGEVTPFVEEILCNLSSIICDLQPAQVHTFYEALGMMIGAQPDRQQQDIMIEQLFCLPNQVWDGIIQMAAQNVESLQEPDTVRQLSVLLRTNVSACRSLGHPYVRQLGRNFMDMLSLYKLLSEDISKAVVAHGELVAKQPLIRAMRGVKKETLRLLDCWVGRSTDPALVSDKFVPPLCEAVLLDYQRNVASAREPEVLALLATIVSKLGEQASQHVPPMLDAVFECTLEMLSQDQHEFPEHRLNLFTLLEAVTQSCFTTLIRLPTDRLRIVLESVLWAVRHSLRSVSETGLSIVLRLLQKVDCLDPAAAGQFHANFFMSLLQHLFSVLTDPLQAGQLSQVSSVLCLMFSLCERDRLHTQLQASVSNSEFVLQSLSALLSEAYPHLQRPQIAVFVQGCFSFNADQKRFREHLRDFLVQIREFTGEDLSDLYLEEQQEEIRRAQEAKLAQQCTVPGILNPHEVQDAMED